MSIEGLILQPGEARGISATAERATGCSMFELSVAPGFDTGAHYHTRIEEFFFVLEGELNLRVGARVVRAGPGTFMFVPIGAVHSYGNPGPNAARVLFLTSPPGFERYFVEISELLAKGGRPDPEAIAALRRKHDIAQV